MATFDSVGGRKFVFAVGVVALSFILVVLGLMGEANWVMLCLGVAGMYIGGNVAQKTFGVKIENEVKDER